MATINGIIRSYQASAKRNQSEQQRKAREMTRLFKEQQKQQDFEVKGNEWYLIIINAIIYRQKKRTKSKAQKKPFSKLNGCVYF